MFDFLKGGKANLTVKLDRDNKIYAPGEIVHATVNVEGVKDLKIQSGIIALVRAEEYTYSHQERDSDGDLSSVKTKTTDETPVWRQQFLGESTIKGGSTQTFEFNLEIPKNGTPSIEDGKILNLTWLVKTTLDRKLASDTEDKQEIYVVVPAPQTPAGGGDLGISNEPSEAEMKLRLPKQNYVLGETIKGELLIQPKKDFDATEVRIEVVCREEVPREEGNTSERTEKIKLAGGTKLTSGQEVILPFEIQIPNARPITAQALHGSVMWNLRGVLARRMRGDTLVKQEIFVYHD